MEAALPFLQRLLLAGIGVFALYQCFQISTTRRPAAAWIARAFFIVIAGICFFSLAYQIGTS